jgi:hypothetical protein
MSTHSISSGDSVPAVNDLEHSDVLPKQAVSLLVALMSLISSSYSRAAAALMQALCNQSNTNTGGRCSSSSWVPPEGWLLLVCMISQSGQSLTSAEWQQAAAVILAAASSPPHSAQQSGEGHGLHRLKSPVTFNINSCDTSNGSNRSSTAHAAKANKKSSRRLVAANLKEAQPEQQAQDTEGASHAAAANAACPAMLAIHVWCLQQLAAAHIPGVCNRLAGKLSNSCWASPWISTVLLYVCLLFKRCGLTRSTTINIQLC